MASILSRNAIVLFDSHESLPPFGHNIGSNDFSRARRCSSLRQKAASISFNIFKSRWSFRHARGMPIAAAYRGLREQAISSECYPNSRLSHRPPAVIPVSGKALAMLLPVSGTGEQVLQQLGGPATWLRRAVVSVTGAAIFYNFNILLTTISALYWAWSPMLSAARGNALLRLKYKYAGIWRARVLEAREMKYQGQQKRSLRVLVGDGSGTEVEMEVSDPSSIAIVRGDPVELVVVSDRSNFSRFLALREMYLPEQSIWMSEQSFVERSVFEQLSKEMAILLLAAKQDEEEDDWEGRCALAADGLAQDVERYKPYPRSHRSLTLDGNTSSFDTWGMFGSECPCDSCGSDLTDASLSSCGIDGADVQCLHDCFRDSE